jgi:hypothetical protein
MPRPPKPRPVTPVPDREVLVLAAQVLTDPDMPADLKSKAGRAMVAYRHARTPSDRRTQITQAARDKQFEQYLAQVPPEVTDPDERRRMALELRRARMMELVLLRSARRAEQKAS